MSSSQSACKIHEGRISVYKGSPLDPEYPRGRGLVNIYWMNKLTKINMEVTVVGFTSW